MLERLGIETIDELFYQSIPENARFSGSLDVPGPLSESEISSYFDSRAAMNAPARGFVSFLGGGAYNHYIPSIVRFVASLPEFYTAYTPYQPEVSQGTLASIFEFQTMICELTGLDVANASLYDGATAIVEAVRVALRKRPSGAVAISPFLHPHTRETLRTYLAPLKTRILELPASGGATADSEVPAEEIAAFVIQTPNYVGNIQDLSVWEARSRDAGALFIVVTDPISLGLLEAPGTLGADICVGEGLGAGIPLSFGGPALGFMAAREEFVRDLPGRIVGETVDARGDRCFVLTLQTREQHIRREKASSNICSNEALCALMMTVYLSWLGPQGLAELARHVYAKTHYARARFSSSAASLLFPNAPSFREFALRLPRSYDEALPAFLERGILPGIPLARYFSWASPADVLVCVTEQTTTEDIDAYASVLEAL